MPWTDSPATLGSKQALAAGTAGGRSTAPTPRSVIPSLPITTFSRCVPRTTIVSPGAAASMVDWIEACAGAATARDAATAAAMQRVFIRPRAAPGAGGREEGVPHPPPPPPAAMRGETAMSRVVRVRLLVVQRVQHVQ